jgi:hypothetical protein
LRWVLQKLFVTVREQDLPEDLEWKIIYVGSAESEEYDQALDTVYVGPVPEGRHMFVFQVVPCPWPPSAPRPTRPTRGRSPRRTWWG